MATVKFVKNKAQSSGALKSVINYCIKEEKTRLDDGQRYVSGINCDGYNAFNEMMLTKNVFPSKNCNGQGDRYFYQYIQSFHPNDNVSPQKAHQIGLEFAQRAWHNQEILVATHIDKEHIHNHFVIGGVDIKNGKRLRQGPNTLKELRTISDEICIKYGIDVLPPYKKTKLKSPSSNEYRAAVNGNSWKFKLAGDIDYVMTIAKDKKYFINLMNRLNYDVLWSDDRKYITYSIKGTNLKCRDIRLHEEKYLKENMENEFKLRQTQDTKFNSSTGSNTRSNSNSSGQGSMGSSANDAGYEFRNDSLQQRNAFEQVGQGISEGVINTGWELERQDYFNGQHSQKQNEGITSQSISDNVSDSSNQQSNISRLDVPTSSIIEDDSDDPEVRELHKKQEEAQRAAAMAFDLIADGIIRHINNNEVEDNYDEDDGQGWGPTMGGI